MSCFIHDVPGRLRIKIPALKHQPHRARRMEDLFKNLDGIERVAANALTGSLKIQYDPDLVDSEQLLDVLKSKNAIDENAVYPYGGENYAVAIRFSQACGKAMINWALGKTLESSGLGLLAALI